MARWFRIVLISDVPNDITIMTNEPPTNSSDNMIRIKFIRDVMACGNNTIVPIMAMINVLIQYSGYGNTIHIGNLNYILLSICYCMTDNEKHNDPLVQLSPM